MAYLSTEVHCVGVPKARLVFIYLFKEKSMLVCAKHACTLMHEHTYSLPEQAPEVSTQCFPARKTVELITLVQIRGAQN